MCLGMLRDSEWKPSTKMGAVLEYIRSLLKGTTHNVASLNHMNTFLLTDIPEPDPDDAVEAKIADQYKQDRAGYEKEAKEWTKRYAMSKK